MIKTKMHTTHNTETMRFKGIVTRRAQTNPCMTSELAPLRI